ncbi:uncharacterized protein [Cicer arietinum]|uniref:Two-component response regulator n=1 Tax=Cicer arietinum TaxID=3827 RepID=A0A1S2YBE1_CICAR|nr:two-component response regulator ORR26 [Cicer arietinum]
MDNGCFTSPRRDFPNGLRVLVVDDDPTWLKILEKMLKKCNYEVTTCCLARQALNLLRERKDGYDIVISDVNMPDMDGFKLLEHVGLEMDLPVIMMSVDGETSRVMKGVQHGACDYLLKPIRMKELRNIWQHVLRKRIHEVREFENFESFESIHLMRNGSEMSEEANMFALEDMTSTKKRKDVDNKHDDKEFSDPSSSKKARVVWSVDLHQKFVKAVNLIGFDKVGPKKILDLMNVPWLTRENVASHLQKYRLYLSRLQKDNEQKSSSSGMKHSDLPSKDVGSFGFPNSANMKHSDLPSKDVGSYGFPNSANKQQNDVPIDRYNYLEGTIQHKNMETKSHEGIPKVTVPHSTTAEKVRAITGNITDAGITHNRPFAPLDSEGKCAVIDCTLSTQYSWTEIPKRQLKEEQESLVHLEDNCNMLPLQGKKHHIQVDQSQSITSISSTPSTKEQEVDAIIKTKHLLADYKKDYTSSVSSKRSVVDTFPFQPGSLMMNDQPSQPISTSNFGLKTQSSNLGCIPDLESYQRSLLLVGEAASAPLDEDLYFYWHNMNFGQSNIGMSEYYDPGLLTEVPTHLYDSTDYSVIDQGLFIA